MYTPWPHAWTRFRNQGGPILISVIVYFLGMTLLATLSLTSGNASAAFLLLLFAASLSLIGVCAFVTTGMSSERGSGASFRIELPNNRHCTFLPNLKAGTALVTLAGLSISVTLLLLPLLMSSIPPSGSWRDSLLRAFAQVAPVIGIAGVAWSLLGPLARKRRALGIGLSPEGVYHWARFGCCFFAWEWVNDIQVTARGAPRIVLSVSEPSTRPGNPEENRISQLHSYRRRSTLLGVSGLAVNPGVAYIALVFYHRHPECRHELATNEGVSRIQKMNFPELIKELERTGTLRSA